MEFQQLIGQMRANAGRIATLAGGVSLEQARWKPRQEDWSILEVVNHLYDEERDPAESLQRFLDERSASLAWLEGLASPNWGQTVQAPWGSISAGDLMTSWANHDTLHMRQLVELLHAWSVRLGEPYSPEYAGSW